MNQIVINGDNIELLKKYPDNYFDAVVTDPPYGLGKEPNAEELMKDWVEKGYHEISGKGFMGKDWDAFIPQPVFWKEVFRVLKHGGHVLSFFGTRTYDWGVMSMRFAGFEVRDCIQWLYGSGFPKSHNISKAIDKKGGNPNLTTDLARDLKKARESRGISKTKADEIFCGGTTLYSWYEGRKDGIQLPTSMYMKKIADAFPELEKYVGLTMEAEREVIGTINKARSSSGDFAMPTMGGETIYKNIDVTTSTTDAAKQWDGWGTALKPANEPIVLARKPLEKGLSVAENILKWGVGGINIDASRIGFKDDADYKESTQKNQHADFGTKPLTNNTVYGDYSMVQPKNYQPEGRFPANIILTHHEDCECIGTKKVKSDGHHSGKVPDNGGLYNLGLKPLEDKGNIHAKNGKEEVENWDCHEDCPIRILDEQSGVSKSSKSARLYINDTEGRSVKNGASGFRDPNSTYGDKGGASRFFYVAKASKSERNKGLEEFEEKPLAFSNQAKAELKRGNLEFNGNGVTGEGIVGHGNKVNMLKNFHPTVKPIKLMQYLVKMITPPNGIVLDPFCGSGTTGVACKIDGFQFVGLEQDPEYAKIAEARINNYKPDIEIVKKEKTSLEQIPLF